MDRRRFLLTPLASVLAAPLVAEAQSADRISRIGFLFFGAPGPSVEVDAFRQGLREPPQSMAIITLEALITP